MNPDPKDLEKIADAVAQAEKTTSGEIAIILARDVSAYREVPVAYAAGAALILPAIAVWLGAKPLALLPIGWSAEHAAALDENIAMAISLYAAAQALIFTLIYFLVAWKPIRKALTPNYLKKQRAHKAAMAQFLATGLDGSPERTGVVVFAALDDHVVEIIADKEIHAKVGARAWDEAIHAMQAGLKRGALGDGLAAGIALCGAALTKHFPAGDDNPNTMSDAPRVI